jgi:hypothetical protein
VDENDIEISTDFHYLIFMPNPIKQNVKVIDDSEMSFIMRVPHFTEIIEKLCGYRMSIDVRNCCAEYGGQFLLDREKAQIKRLYYENIRDGLNFKELDIELKGKSKLNEKEDVLNTYNNVMKVTAGSMEKYGVDYESKHNK